MALLTMALSGKIFTPIQTQVNGHTTPLLSILRTSPSLSMGAKRLNSTWIVYWVWNFPMTQIFILGQIQINPFPWGQKCFWMKYVFLTGNSPMQRSQSSMDQAAEILAYARK